MTWYKETLKKYKKEIIDSVIVSLVVSILFSLWYFTQGKVFELTEINPISAPILSFRFLSALVFVSFGEIIYNLGFYYVLHFIVAVILKDRPLYNRIKRAVWDLMMFIMGFVVLPWIIDLLNKIISFFYNIYLFLLYVFPPFGIAVGVFGISFLVFKKIKDKK